MSTPWRRIAILLIVAFAVRVAVGCVWQSRLAGQQFGLGDSDGYWRLGRAIAEGQPYEYGVERHRMFRTPGYPLLLAPIIRLFGDGPAALSAARIEAALFGTLAVLMVWWLAKLLFDDRTAWIAAVSATFYPGAIPASVLILSEAPFCPLMLLQLALWVLTWRATSRRSRAALGFAAGLAAGAATLMRPSWLLFTPFAAVAGVAFSAKQCLCGKNKDSVGLINGAAAQRCDHDASDISSETVWRHAAIACWMFLGLAVAMSPWWLRNARWTGRFTPTTLQVGASLYDGLNPKATGASNMDFVSGFVNAQIAQEGEAPGDPNALFEQKLDRRMRDASLAWAASHPGDAVRLAGVKFLRMWNVWPNERQWSRWPIRWAIFFTYTPFLIFAIMGACRTFRRGWPYRLCWLPAVYLTLLHIVFVSSLRYREPAMLAMLVLAAEEVGRLSFFRER